MRMERLVRDLLRLARLDAGQEAARARALLGRQPASAPSRPTCPGLIAARRQHVERHIAPDATTVPGDPAKLQDALRNLLENATNYSPEGGRIVARGAARGGPDRHHGGRRGPRHPAAAT